MSMYFFSDKGPRSINQDSFCAESMKFGFLLGVADGVGGNQGGEVASQKAIEILKDGVRKGISLKHSALKAHEQIKMLADTDPSLMGMATTLTAVLIQGRNLCGVHCGDSRTYILRNKGLKQLSEDHTEVAELLLSGKISKREAIDYPRKNIITSAIGIKKSLKIQSFEYKLHKNDRILLLTDGIYSLISKRQIVKFSLEEDNFELFCKKIIDEVADIGPSDNFTLLGTTII